MDAGADLRILPLAPARRSAAQAGYQADRRAPCATPSV